MKFPIFQNVFFIEDLITYLIFDWNTVDFCQYLGTGRKPSQSLQSLNTIPEPPKTGLAGNIIHHRKLNFFIFFSFSFVFLFFSLPWRAILESDLRDSLELSITSSLSRSIFVGFHFQNSTLQKWPNSAAFLRQRNFWKRWT